MVYHVEAPHANESFHQLPTFHSAHQQWQYLFCTPTAHSHLKLLNESMNSRYMLETIECTRAHLNSRTWNLSIHAEHTFFNSIGGDAILGKTVSRYTLTAVLACTKHNSHKNKWITQMVSCSSWADLRSHGVIMFQDKFEFANHWRFIIVTHACTFSTWRQPQFTRIRIDACVLQHV